MSEAIEPEDYRLRLAIFRAPGCPACRAAGAAEQRSLRWFLRENYGEAPTLKVLLHKRVCVRHAWPMLMGDHPHLTRTFEFLARSRLHHASDQGRRGLLLRSRSKSRPEASPCMICDVGERAANVAVLKVLKLLDSEPGRAAYLQHRGLCLPHHDQAVERAEGELAEFLAGHLRSRLESFLELFQLYDRHRDVRFQHEPKGVEQEAWRHALRFFWGDVAVQLELEDDGYQPWQPEP